MAMDDVSQSRAAEPSIDEIAQEAMSQHGEHDDDMSPPLADSSLITVRELRRRWKPLKDGAAAADAHEPIRIRLHRCFSWLRHVEELAEVGAAADDARLIYGWIALNSLYGRWDPERREPIGDVRASEQFTRTIFKHDHDGVLRDLLQKHKKLAESLVNDPYLGQHYWRSIEVERADAACEPAPPDTHATQRVAAGHAHPTPKQPALHKFRSALREERYRSAADLVLERVYLARCQLVHGAASYNGRLNRAAVRRSARWLALWVPGACRVLIDHGWELEWGGLCYPPQK